MSHGVGMHAPMAARLGEWAVSAAIVSPVMRRRVPVFMGLRAAMREAVLRVGGEAE